MTRFTPFTVLVAAMTFTFTACPIDISDDDDKDEDCTECSDSGDTDTDTGTTDSGDTDTDTDTDADTDSGDSDADDDGFSAEPDCDDSDAGINPDADEICDAIDNDCDGEIDEGCEEDGIYDITITVTSSNLDHIDFSYGYCSDKDNPADCSAWNQSVVTATGSTISWTGVVYATGVIRANSSFFVGSDTTADHWLCEGYSKPTLTAAVQVWIEGKSMGDGGVWGVPYSSGCSAGLDIAALIAQYKD